MFGALEQTLVAYPRAANENRSSIPLLEKSTCEL